jgi:two-component system OmpR family response regulator
METLVRILHVDDEPDLRDIVTIALETFGGYTVQTCSSGLEALDKSTSFAPNLILLDMMMPGMDGPTTLRELRKNPKTAAIPVIFMTAKVQPDEIRHYDNLGAAGAISKPFDVEKLCPQIKAIWDKVKAAEVSTTRTK